MERLLKGEFSELLESLNSRNEKDGEKGRKALSLRRTPPVRPRDGPKATRKLRWICKPWWTGGKVTWHGSRLVATACSCVGEGEMGEMQRGGGLIGPNNRKHPQSPRSNSCIIACNNQVFISSASSKKYS